METEKQQSPNWKKYENECEKIYQSKYTIQGFPFDEKFPNMYSGKKYKLILSTGEKCKARVDDSREFMSEGLEWKLLSYTDKFSQGETLEKSYVVAWKEI